MLSLKSLYFTAVIYVTTYEHTTNWIEYYRFYVSEEQMPGKGVK